MQDSDLRQHLPASAVASCWAVLAILLSEYCLGAPVDIVGPPGSGAFGSSVRVLPNGNFVVADPDASAAAPHAGAVYLYNSAGVRLSTLSGSKSEDHVGNAGVTILANGNFVVVSSAWVDDAHERAGAVTWVNGATGLSAIVSANNSLVGGTPLGAISDGSSITVTSLANGNYVVASPRWANGAVEAAGAVTWGNGSVGVAGVISAANSLVGSSTADWVGSVTALSNGNYVVASVYWSDGATSQVGAATWANGATGANGAISSANSLTGSSANDHVGMSVAALRNGNYVVGSGEWQSGGKQVGAATWANGKSGLTGAVSAANSLVGTSYGDGVGWTIVPLTNGNYVVPAPGWSNGGQPFAGAVTFGNGAKGITGPVSVANSLVGTTIGDAVGSESVVALVNGNYVVASVNWHNGDAAQAGAVTWGNGKSGTFGAVSVANSLVGSGPQQYVGSGGVTALTNGNYVTASPSWHEGAGTGAVTWGNGSSGTVGLVSGANSLTGSVSRDSVGSGGVVALSNGNYVVVSPLWQNRFYEGAVTWGNGNGGTAGAVTLENSLISGYSVIASAAALTHGNYIVRAEGLAIGDGSAASSGTIAPNNALFADSGFQDTGSGGVEAFPDGNFAVLSPNCWNGGIPYAGCVTLANDLAPLTGNLAQSNSVFGATRDAGTRLVYSYDVTHHRLIVGRPADNIVSLLGAPSPTGSAVNMNQHGITGSWFNPATGGQGFEIEVFPDFPAVGQGVLSLGWFTFDTSASGGKRWYVLQGTATSNGEPAQLLIATSYGGNFDAPPSVGGTVVGSATLRFDDCFKATLTYEFTDGSGRSGTIPLIRLTSNVSCLPGGDNLNIAGPYLLSGNWYRPNTSGQGLIVDVNPGQHFLFATWYTFSANGQQTGGAASQRWYTLQSGDWIEGTTSLDGVGIYTANGGEFDRPTPTTTERVGTASVQFTTCKTLLITYQFSSGDNEGKSGTLSLSRVGPTPAGCEDQNYFP